MTIPKLLVSWHLLAKITVNLGIGGRKGSWPPRAGQLDVALTIILSVIL